MTNADLSTALVTALYDRTQLFDRYGEPVPADATVQVEGGKPFYVRRDKCCRCGGSGIYTKFHGTCYRCGGLGRVDHLDTHVVKLYTVEQNAKLDAAQDKRRAAKDAKAQAKAEVFAAAFDNAHADLLATIPAEWLDTRTAFWSQFRGYASATLTPNADGYGYANDTRPQAPDCLVVLHDIVSRGRRFGSLSAKQLGFAQQLASEAQSKLDQLAARLAAKAEQAATSQFVGTVGEKLVDVAVTCQSVAKFERPAFNSYSGRIEVVSVCTFVDARGFVYVTKTPTFRAEVGETGYLSGTVKAHTEYQGVKQTQLIRPKLVAR